MTSDIKISAGIPTNGRREEGLKEIVRYIKPLFDEVIIERDTENKVYTRYLGIKKAKNDIVYTQDDDCLVYNIVELIDNYKEGVIIANARPDSLRKYRDTGIALVGFGSIFDKNLINVLDDFKQHCDKDLFNRECDRAFTYLNKVETIMGDIKDFPSYMTGLSIEPEHEDYLLRIKDALKEY